MYCREGETTDFVFMLLLLHKKTQRTIHPLRFRFSPYAFSFMLSAFRLPSHLRYNTRIILRRYFLQFFFQRGTHIQ